jgi:hypothetical protein
MSPNLIAAAACLFVLNSCGSKETTIVIEKDGRALAGAPASLSISHLGKPEESGSWRGTTDSRGSIVFPMRLSDGAVYWLSDLSSGREVRIATGAVKGSSKVAEWRESSYSVTVSDK